MYFFFLKKKRYFPHRLVLLFCPVCGAGRSIFRVSFFYYYSGRARNNNQTNTKTEKVPFFCNLIFFYFAAKDGKDAASNFFFFFFFFFFDSFRLSFFFLLDRLPHRWPFTSSLNGILEFERCSSILPGAYSKRTQQKNKNKKKKKKKPKRKKNRSKNKTNTSKVESSPKAVDKMAAVMMMMLMMMKEKKKRRRMMMMEKEVEEEEEEDSFVSRRLDLVSRPSVPYLLRSFLFFYYYYFFFVTPLLSHGTALFLFLFFSFIDVFSEFCALATHFSVLPGFTEFFFWVGSRFYRVLLGFFWF